MKKLLVAILCCTISSVSAGPTPTPSTLESALMRVKDTNPLRAKIKMDELLGSGAPISAAVQAAVKAKAVPTPTPGKTIPSPTPDGL